MASAEVSDTGYLEVATNTFSDLASFCARQPGVCETAGFVAHKLELKAKYGARLIYEWASEANSTPVAVQPDLAMAVIPSKQHHEAGFGQTSCRKTPSQRFASMTLFRSGAIPAKPRPVENGLASAYLRNRQFLPEFGVEHEYHRKPAGRFRAS